MEFNIENQLIKGMEFDTLVISVPEEKLISDVAIHTIFGGVSYYNGVLTVNRPFLMGSNTTLTEAYIDNNKILKLK
jgi:hypothetical protein